MNTPGNFPLQQRLPDPELQPIGDGELLDRFLDYVQKKGLELYPAQEEAILALYDGQNVILNTPTGSGKSLVALALHFHSLATGKKSYYTCPIKALVNEKFLALCQDFGPDKVGMITGDTTVNPEAPIICCTAEILSNLALREGEKTPVDDVIMDEFHYYSDRERGVAWQIPLLTMPKARFMLMSATLGDVSFFENELTRLTNRPTLVVRSLERPVPLTFVYQETHLHETVQNLVANGKAPVYLVSFSQREAAEEAQNLMSVDVCTKEEKQRITAALTEMGLRFSSPFGKEMQKLIKHGIGLHHAGLLPKYRYIVERLAQKGLLKVISGTDTLGVGVNIPIRTVLFTKLCKFDGSKSTILSVRDFKQISGRAGRKGFDDQGFVTVQAPEHVIENLRLDAKAGGDAKKLRKVVKKKPPEKGFVLWTKETFEKLMQSQPEALMSRFQVSHGMLLNVLSRPGDGCAAMYDLVNRSHENPGSKRRMRRLAFQMFRSLIERRIVEFTDEPVDPKRERRRALRVNVDLQEDFSIHHALALYLLDTVKLVDPNGEDYALNLLTLVESIVENPEVILRKQLDRLKTERMTQMKMEGVEYDDRIAELEKLEYPKPLREFIYDTFNEFAAKHPWVGQDNIRPKSIAREMYENFMTFPEYVREYDLQRSEGLLLRYLAEVYKVLVQTLPTSCKNEEMLTIVDYFAVIVKGVDSTLLDEWERMRRPEGKPLDEAPKSPDVVESYDITRNRREFHVAIRNEVFQNVKALAAGRPEWIVQVMKEREQDVRDIGRSLTGQGMTVDQLREQLDAYRQDHIGPLIDRHARQPNLMEIENTSNEVLKVRQTLVDEAFHNDWVVDFLVDLAASRACGRVVLQLVGLGELAR